MSLIKHTDGLVERKFNSDMVQMVMTTRNPANPVIKIFLLGHVQEIKFKSVEELESWYDSNIKQMS